MKQQNIEFDQQRKQQSDRARESATVHAHTTLK